MPTLAQHYDAVLLHFKNYPERLPFGQPEHEGLRKFVESGGGLIVAHFGCGAFQEWDGMVKTIGRVWNPEFRAHDKYGPFEVRIADAEHPITQGMDAFKTEDELYTCLDGAEPIRVLCDAVSNVDGKTYPMGLIPENGKGRVFLCTLGHDVNAFQSEGTRTLYRRAVAWAAGLEPLPAED
jgi:type 1 glutamine amidotransferase